MLVPSSNGLTLRIFILSDLFPHWTLIVPFVWIDVITSEAAPCPLQPCYFAKWDILADISDYQYVMGFPACIFDHFLPIFRIPCHRLMYERDCPIFQKLFFPKIRIPVQLLFCLSISKLVYYYRIIMLLFMGFLFWYFGWAHILNLTVFPLVPLQVSITYW